MDFTTYVRKPFIVEAVQITEENIEEIAGMVGKFRVRDDGVPYIALDQRRFPAMYKVYVGYWVTRMDNRLRCFPDKTFKYQFVETNENIEQWLTYLEVTPPQSQISEESVLDAESGNEADIATADIQ